MSLAWQDIRIEEGAVTSTPCDCCGTRTLVVEGDLIASEGWLAFYTARFTEGHRSNGIAFQIGTGTWSEDTAARDRWLFRAIFDPAENSFMIVDTPPDTGIVATALRRDDIIGSPFAAEAFAMLDAIFMKDNRLEVIRT